MKNIAALCVIPPTQILDFNAYQLKRALSLLDLDLLPAMSELKCYMAIKKDFHAARGGLCKII